MPIDDASLLVCDLTQSYSPNGGGGIRTYLRNKRRHVLENTRHRLLQIVPGPEDRVVEDGRHIWVEVGSDFVRGSRTYRFILRTSKVHEVLRRYRPDVIESLCPWVLPWTAINHRKAFPDTALVAGYHTDFPNAQVHRVALDLCGPRVANVARWLIMGYAEITYREFDRVYTLGEAEKALLASRGIDRVDVLDLGVRTDSFHPGRRDPAFRERLGIAGDGPLLVYAGRIDTEKGAPVLIEMMRHLPRELRATLLLIGEGRTREQLEPQVGNLPIRFLGFMADRDQLATALASADIYVSAMPAETFGISVAEAQACGLPVVGVSSGAMPERVPLGLGRLGPVGDARAMADNVLAVWRGDRAAMGQAARSHAERRYSWDRTFERLFEDIYRVALAHARKRTAPARRRTPRLGALLSQET